MSNEITVEKDKIYLDKWLVGSVVRTFTGKHMFAADVDYCSPLDTKNLRDIADRIDAMNEARKL